MLLRRKASVSRLLSRYGMESFTDLEYPELRKYLKVLVLNTKGEEVGWVKEIKVRKKDKKVVEVLIEDEKGDKIKVDPLRLVIYEGNLFLLDEVDEESINELASLLNATIKPVTYVGVPTREEGTRDGGILRKLDSDDEGTLKYTLEFLSSLEKELKEQLNDLITQWFTGKISLDDFMDKSQGIRNKLDKIKSVKEALKGIASGLEGLSVH